MPHLRKRHAERLYQNALSFSPLVGIFGHRQSGKTTFMTEVLQNYVTFDVRSVLDEAQTEPDRFLKSLLKQVGSGHKGDPIGIDEAQMAPAIFPALKEWVRTHKRPGQFVLSGSVRFYSRKAIKESLTGRIVNIDLLPMDLTELDQMTRAQLPLQLIAKSQFSSSIESSILDQEFKRRAGLIKAYLECGGLPGICFLRDQKSRAQLIESQLKIILDRDLRMVYPTTISFLQLQDFMQQIALGEGAPLQTTQIKKSTGISELTQKKLITALEAVFLLRVLPVKGDRKGIALFLEDQAEAKYFRAEELSADQHLVGLVYRNIRCSFMYETGLDCRFSFFQWRGVHLPIVVQTPQGALGILVINNRKPTTSELNLARKFLQLHSKALVLVVTFGQKETIVLEPRILQIPAERLLFE